MDEMMLGVVALTATMLSGHHSPVRHQDINADSAVSCSGRVVVHKRSQVCNMSLNALLRG